MGFAAISGSGYVGNDPRINTTQTGSCILSFNVPVKNKDETGWIKCTVFGKGAEYAKDHIRKGTFVSFSGRLQPFSYTNKQGMVVTGFECNVSPFCLDWPQQKQQQQPAPQQQQPAPQQQQQYRQPAPQQAAVNLDDIPF